MALKKPKINFKELKQKLKDNYPEIKKRATGTEGIVYGACLFAFVFLILIIVQSCTPRTGNILYGMCSQFLQLQVQFPETIQHKDIELYRRAARIYYTHIDGFGEYQLEMIECSFYQDDIKGVQLESVFFNKVKEVTSKTRAEGKGRLYPVEKKYIDSFNISRSPAAIMGAEPNLEIPEDATLSYY